MALTTDEQARAEAIVGQWYWQTADGHNYRWSHAVNTLTRYYESAPLEADMLQLVIEYLRTQTETTEILVHNKKLTFDTPWVAKDAWYQTAPGDKFAGSESSKVRIYQALIQVDDTAAADGPYTIENGCQYKVSHTFYWAVSELPALTASTSGVEYTLQGVSRDRETGLFSCVVEERERVEQAVALYDQAVTAFEKLEEAQYIGVKASEVAGKGLQASAASGVIVKRQISKNPDCTSNIENQVITEIEATGAVKRWQKTLRGTVEETIDRNKPAAIDGSSMAVGETRTTELTPGKRYNNTVRKVTAAAAGKVATDCVKTAFEHQHQELSNQLAAPSSDEAPVAAAGVVVRKTARKTEEETWDVTTQTTEEVAATGAVKRFQKTLRGTVEETTDRNQENPLTNGSEEGGTPMVVGETRTTELTPGKRYNNTVRLVTAEAAGKVATDCVKTAFEHQHQELSNQLAAPSSDEAPLAAAGVVVRKTARKTEEETWDVTTQTTEEVAVSAAVKEYRKTLHGTVIQTTDRNQENPLTDGSEEGGTPMEIGEVRRSEKTPGQRNNNTVQKFTPATSGTIANVCMKSGDGTSGAGNVHVDTKVELVEQMGVDHQTGEQNKVSEVSFRQNDDKSIEKTTRTTVYAPKLEEKTWTDDRYEYTYAAYRNYVAPVIPSSGEAISCSFSPNDHGSFDGSYTIRTLIVSEGQTLQWSLGPANISSKFYYFNKQGKLCSRLFSGTVYRCGGKLSHVATAIQTKQTTGACSIPAIGWHTGVSGSYNNAFGVAYTITAQGPEVVEDSGS